MKIESVESILAGRWHFVRITTDTGIVGVGESGIWGYPEASERIVDVWKGYLIGQDDKDPDSYVMSLSQSGLGMPDRDYYLSPDPKLAAAKVAYEKHIAAMLKLAGAPLHSP